MLEPFASALSSISALASAPVAALLQHGHEAQRGYAWLFVLMASMPYLLLLVIGGGIYRARKRAREREVEEALSEQVEWEASHPPARSPGR